MGRSVLSLLLTGVLAIVLGILASVAVASVALTSSKDAADKATSADLGKPTSYGAR